jgi:hypothetical protein
MASQLCRITSAATDTSVDTSTKWLARSSSSGSLAQRGSSQLQKKSVTSYIERVDDAGKEGPRGRSASPCGSFATASKIRSFARR